MSQTINCSLFDKLKLYSVNGISYSIIGLSFLLNPNVINDVRANRVHRTVLLIITGSLFQITTRLAQSSFFYRNFFCTDLESRISILNAGVSSLTILLAQSEINNEVIRSLNYATFQCSMIISTLTSAISINNIFFVKQEKYYQIIN